MTKQSKNTRRKSRPEALFKVEDDHSFVQVPISEICDKLNVHPKTVYRWQKGTQRPDKNTALLMRILFLGHLPFEGFSDRFRIVDSGEKTYHQKPIYHLQPVGGGRPIRPTSLQAFYDVNQPLEMKLARLEHQLAVVTAERDHLANDVADLKAEIERLENLILQRQKARANVVRLIKG